MFASLIHAKSPVNKQMVKITPLRQLRQETSQLTMVKNSSIETTSPKDQLINKWSNCPLRQLPKETIVKKQMVKLPTETISPRD
jgi:hypothetical protein